MRKTKKIDEEADHPCAEVMPCGSSGAWEEGRRGFSEYYPALERTLVVHEDFPSIKKGLGWVSRRIVVTLRGSSHVPSESPGGLVSKSVLKAEV